MTKYQVGFSAGALLIKEFEGMYQGVQNPEAVMSSVEKLNADLIPVNSETARKRLGSEVSKRTLAMANPDFIRLFLNGNSHDRILICFYAACKTYKLIGDFMIEFVLNKWYNLDTELENSDFQNYLFRKMDKHPELELVTEKTRYKLAQVMMKMLKEAGLLSSGKLQKVSWDSTVLPNIVQAGDAWFLDIIFLNHTEKSLIIGNA